MRHPRVAKIDCADCSKFAYDLKTGKRLLTGDQPIPVRCPPCKDDDTVCPKVRPGYSDFSEAASEVYWHWRMCNELDSHPPEPEAKRFRKILDSIEAKVENEREQEQHEDRMEELKRARNGR